MNISHLVEKIKKGDNKSFEKLYKLTEREVWFTCISFLKNETTAQDIMQETYITAFLKIQSLEKSSQIRSWLNRIAVNKCKNYLKGKGEIQLDDEIFENQAIVDERISIPEEYISDKAKREIILSIMQEVLSDVQYQTVIMHYFNEMTVDEIISKVNMTYKRVTLTGGEPLVHTDSAELVLKLTDIGCDVNIETNGAVDIVDFLGKVPKSDNLFFTIDYKLPSSGMTDKMIWNNFINLQPCDVIKFVIGSDEDMNLTIDIVKKLKQVYTEMPHIYLGAVYGMYDAQKLVNIMLKEPVLCDATFQIQLHKVIWDPEERGV